MIRRVNVRVPKYTVGVLQCGAKAMECDGWRMPLHKTVTSKGAPAHLRVQLASTGGNRSSVTVRASSL